MTFDEQLMQSVQHAVLDQVRKGEWVKLPRWESALPIDVSTLRSLLTRVDMARVQELVVPKIEQMVADAMIQSVATEIATDVKKIMSNQEIREDLRATIREKLRQWSKGAQAERKGN